MFISKKLLSSYFICPWLQICPLLSEIKRQFVVIMMSLTQWFAQGLCVKSDDQMPRIKLEGTTDTSITWSRYPAGSGASSFVAVAVTMPNDLFQLSNHGSLSFHEPFGISFFQDLDVTMVKMTKLVQSPAKRSWKTVYRRVPHFCPCLVKM